MLSGNCVRRKLSVKNFLLFALAITLCRCGSQPQQESVEQISTRVIDGQLVSEGASPQIVRFIIISSGGRQSSCSGTVISSRHIVTAAHCIPDDPEVGFVLSTPEPYILTEFYRHPVYYTNEYGIFNDVAIIASETPIGLPALGLLASTTPAVDDTVNLFGYGMDENFVTGALKMGSMRLIAVTENHLIARFDPGLSGACYGDSGGPATHAVTDSAGNVIAVGIVGIVSAGNRADCGQGGLTAFTAIHSQAVLDFILSVVPDAALI